LHLVASILYRHPATGELGGVDRSAPAWIALRDPPTSTSVADNKRTGSVLLSTAARDPCLIALAPLRRAHFLNVAVSALSAGSALELGAHVATSAQRGPEMMLKGKVAVIYGAGGAIGGAVAHAFAREGAKLFLTGRSLAPVVAVAREVVSAGGSAAAAEVDALDERAVDQHLQSVIDTAGRLDISFNAVGIPDTNILGVPLVELDVEQFSLPITTYTVSYFLTARLAARRMIANKSGVIMTVTALHSRMGIPLVGGYGPAMAAKEALTRDLSAELAPHGIRVVGLRPQGLPETDTLKEAFEPRAKATGMTWEQFQQFLASRTHTRRLMTLDEMANVAVFMASDKASGMTGTTANLTMGSLDD
jgi:NAD(P)-dependent dehydrogenase (short-subunit alcohol dehydrogenase family)